MKRKTLLIGGLLLLFSLSACSVFTPPERSKKNETPQSSNDETSKNDDSSKEHSFDMNKWDHDEFSHWHPCLDAGFENLRKDENKHDFIETQVAATYEEGGYSLFKCRVCAYEYREDTSEKLEHNYGAYSYDNTGHWKVCTDPGYENLVTPKEGHILTSRVSKEATYDEEGIKTYSCRTCGYSYEETISRIPHNLSTNYQYDNNAHWQTCYDPGYENQRFNEEEHNFTSKVVLPTFEEGGYTRYTCSKCGYFYDADETEILPHNYSYSYNYNEEYHWRDCIDQGYEGLSLSEAHTFVLQEVPATFEQSGYRYYVCSKCGYAYTPEDSYIEPLVHNFSTEWTTNNEKHWRVCIDEGYENLITDEGYHTDLKLVCETMPTATEPGKCHYECGICGDIYRRWDGEIDYVDLTALNDRFTYTLNADGESYTVNFDGVQQCEPIEDLYLPNTFNDKPVTKATFTYSGGRYFKRIHVPANIVDVSKCIESYDGSFINHDNPNYDKDTYLEEWVVSEDNEYYTAQDGILYSKDKSILYNYPTGKIGTRFETMLCVKEIGNNAFYHTKLENIILSNVEIIDETAIEFNVNLKSVTVGNNIKRVDYAAINNTYPRQSGQERVINPNLDVIFTGLSDSFESIDAYSFHDYLSLENATLYNDIYYLGTSSNPYYLALTAKKDIVHASLHEDCKAVTNYCFSDCNELVDATIGGDVTTLHLPFINNEKLKTITLGENITLLKGLCNGAPSLETLYWNAKNCYCDEHYAVIIGPLKTMILGDNVERLLGRGYAMYHTTGLEEISLNEGLKEIDFGFFAGTDIKEITLPESLENLRPYAFGESSLEKIIWKSKNLSFEPNLTGNPGIDNVMTSSNYRQFSHCLIKEVVFEESVESLPDLTNKFNAFTNENVELITYKVKDMSVDSSNYIQNVNEVVFTSNVERIPSLFKNSNVSKVTLANGVKNIDYAAFSNCPNLKELIIPSSVETIEVEAFDGRNLKCLYFEDFSNLNLHQTFFANYYSPTIYFKDNEPNLSSFDNQKLSIVTGVDTLKHINIDGAEYCLEDVLEDGNVKHLATLTKYYNATESGVSLVIPDSISVNGADYLVTRVGEYAFYGSSAITSLSVGKNIEYISANAFEDCSEIRTINWNAINCQDHSSGLFKNCMKLREVNFGNDVVRIPSYTFAELKNVYSITISNSVSEIGGRAFFSSRALKRIVIGENVTSIGEEAFGFLLAWEVIDLSKNTGMDLHYICGNPNIKVLDDISESNISLVNDQFVTYTEGEKVTLLMSIDTNDVHVIGVPEGVTDLDSYAFQNATNAVALFLPSTVSKISSFALQFLENLEFLGIDKNLTSIEEGAFSSVGQRNALFKVFYSGTEEEYQDINVFADTLNKEAFVNAHEVIYNCSIGQVEYDGKFTTAMINGVKTLVDFEGKANEYYLWIPEGVEAINVLHYFDDIYAYTVICFPSSLVSLNAGDFVYTLYVSSSPVTYSLFGYTSFLIPNTVQSINSSVFDNVYWVRTIYFEGTEEEWNSLISGSSEKLSGADIYFYSKNRPSSSGNYWHYNEDGYVVLW